MITSASAETPTRVIAVSAHSPGKFVGFRAGSLITASVAQLWSRPGAKIAD
jgi:hypothetical protein